MGIDGPVTEIKYNETSSDRNKKYTLNIPIELYEKAKAKARKAGIYRVSIYFRALIEREVAKDETFSMVELISQQRE
jgi:hypothetical protein